MSSILSLATKYRPTVHRLLQTRSLILSTSIGQQPAVKKCRQTSVGNRLALFRYVATQIQPTHVSQQSGPSFKSPRNTTVRSKRTLEIMENLQQSMITLPFISFEELKTTVDAYVTAQNALPLMKACSRQLDRSVNERVELVDRIWKFLKNSNDPITTPFYVALIESYRCCGKAIDDPYNFLVKIGAPNEAEIHEELFLLLCANNRSIDAATDFLRHMKENGFAVTERMYTALIVGVAAHTKSMEKIDGILEEMHLQQVAESLETQVALIKANIECGNEHTAIKMLNQRNDWESNQLYSIIRSAAMNCSDDGVVKNALHLLPAPILNSKLIATELQNICLELLHASTADRYYDPYELIVRHLPPPVFVNENTDEYGVFMIKEMISLNVALPRLVQLCENLITSERNTRAIHVCCGFAYARNLPNTIDLLRVLATKEPLRPHYFWPLFVKAESEEQIFAIIKLAANTNAELDTMTIEKYILPKIPLTVNDSMLAVKTLEGLGLRMLPLRTALISHLLMNDRPHDAMNIAKSHNGRIDAAHVKSAIASFTVKNSDRFKESAKASQLIRPILQLIRDVQSKTNNRHYDMIGDILRIVSHNGAEVRREFSSTALLIRGLASSREKISAAAADSVLTRMKKKHDVHVVNEPKLSAMIDYYQFHDEEEGPPNHNDLSCNEHMENKLIQLETNQMDTRDILTKLFLQCVREKKYDRALEVHKKCLDAEIEKSPVMMSATLDLMTNTSNECEALETIENLQTNWPQFSTELDKIIELAKLLVEKNRLQDAETILSRFASSTKKNNVNYVKRNIWELLQAVTDYSVRSKSSTNSSKIMLDKLVEMGYCEYAKTNLDPIIRELIEKGQVKATVDEFERMASEHHTTPQLLTLLTLLIDLINADDGDKRWKLYELNRPLVRGMLQRIVDVAKKLNKPAYVNTEILTAFAISGTEQQIRKFLMNPSMRFNVEQLIHNLKHRLNVEGRIAALIKLAKSNRGLRHEAISEESLYTLQLDSYAKDNDHTAALELYKAIGEDVEYVMSGKLKQKFHDLFTRNNIKIG